MPCDASDAILINLFRSQGVHAAACVCSVKVLIDSAFDTPAAGGLGQVGGGGIGARGLSRDQGRPATRASKSQE
jgi:hypothetical protein